MAKGSAFAGAYFGYYLMADRAGFEPAMFKVVSPVPYLLGHPIHNFINAVLYMPAMTQAVPGLM